MFGGHRPGKCHCKKLLLEDATYEKVIFTTRDYVLTEPHNRPEGFEIPEERIPDLFAEQDGHKSAS